jgi:hypothetical protein
MPVSRLGSGPVRLCHSRSGRSVIAVRSCFEHRAGRRRFADTLAEPPELAAASRGAQATVLRLRVPSSIASQLKRGVIGEFRDLRFVDVARGTGFERILFDEWLTGFNAAMKRGAIGVSRIPVGGF